MAIKKKMGKRRPRPRFKRNTAKYQMSKDVTIDYKNLTLLQKYLNDRGKIIPRRITGVTAKQQRLLASAVKQARYLALLITGSVKR